MALQTKGKSMGNRMHRLLWSVGALAVVTGVLAFAVSAQEPKPAGKAETKPAETASTPKPATCKVEKAPFHVDVTLKGVFEAQEMHEIAIHPRPSTVAAFQGAISVVKAVEHGKPVKKGDVLVEIDLDKINQAIKDRVTERAVSEVAIREAEEELPVLEKTQPVDLAAAERGKRQADEDYKRFLDVDRALMEESAEQSFRSANYYLESAREELKQLEKMYRAKDLTEETEEYILKRQRQQVKEAEFYLKSATIFRDQALKVELPRREVNLKENTVKQGLALDKIKNVAPLTLSQKKLALQKLKLEYAKSGEELARLEEDRKALTVTAPADGIVYYGRPSEGQWSAASSMETKLRRGGILQPEEVLMTVVNPQPMFVRAVIEEKDLHWLKPGMAGKATITGYPGKKFPARITKISMVPQAPGKFDAQISVAAGDESTAIMPGMNCETKFVTHKKDDALLVNSSAVFPGEGDDDGHYVYMLAKEEKRPVKIGETNGQKTEILEGLKVGDEILSEKPKAKS
jgi:multidrug efflux pump subunit AcrA (membrane-fusion protein)